MEQILKSRAEKLLKTLPKNFEAALIQTETSRFYLLDYDAGDAGTLLLLPDRMVYFIDSRYIESARREVTNAEVVLQKELYTQLDGVLHKAGVKKIYLENQISVALLEKNREKLPGFRFDVTSCLSGAIEGLRQIKDAEEIGRIRKAQAITDQCFEHILPFLVPGAREVDVMLEMERFIRANGAEKVAFDTILIAGAKTSLPHGQPGEYRMQKGDFVTLDFGARYRGYCSDMTRTVALGEPGEKKREVYGLVLQAHYEGIRAAKAGRCCRDVDAAARNIIREAGYGEYFGHGLGHGVGIEIHEEPRFSPACEQPVRSGMMMTVEPGVYLPGEFGCRIEDTVLVGQDGCEPLPASPKELIIL